MILDQCEGHHRSLLQQECQAISHWLKVQHQAQCHPMLHRPLHLQDAQGARVQVTMNGAMRATRERVVSDGGVSSQCHERVSGHHQDTAWPDEAGASICHIAQTRKAQVTDEGANGHGMVKAHDQTHPQSVT